MPLENNAPNGNYEAVISFIVNEDGSLSDFTIEKNPGYGTGEEALRVMKQCPPFTPAIVNGKPVKYRHKQSIRFTLG